MTSFTFNVDLASTPEKRDTAVFMKLKNITGRVASFGAGGASGVSIGGDVCS
jgi:hypothetical protein